LNTKKWRTCDKAGAPFLYQEKRTDPPGGLSPLSDGNQNPGVRGMQRSVVAVVPHAPEKSRLFAGLGSGCDRKREPIHPVVSLIRRESEPKRARNAEERCRCGSARTGKKQAFCGARFGM